jgi:transposase
MIRLDNSVQVYLLAGPTDMRKSVNGLSALVEKVICQDPFSGHLFAFCNKGKDLVKVLYWDRNGFCIWYKRYERHRLHWPQNANAVRQMSTRELLWILDGLDLEIIDYHEDLKFTVAS